MNDTSGQSSLNAEFWDDLCGSSLARSLGIEEVTSSSLEKFDEWYFDYYSYLLPFAKLETLRKRTVLEVGLGYGSLTQKIAEAGADLTALDIAPGPVEMANFRLSNRNLPGKALQGDVLESPFPNESFDAVIAIGSLHHTGNFAQALREIHRITKPGAQLIFMVYYAYSYRRVAKWPGDSFRHALWSLGWNALRPISTYEQREAYDTDAGGVPAPSTDFFSKRELRDHLDGWSIDAMETKNVGDEGPLSRIPRKLKLGTIGPWAGLDVYVKATRK